MDKQKEVLRILLKHYTKIELHNGISKVIFDDDFENIAEEIVKLFAIPVVSGSASKPKRRFQRDIDELYANEDD